MPTRAAICLWFGVPSFRQVRHQRGGQDGPDTQDEPDTRYSLEQIVALSPQRAAAQQVDQFAIGLLEARC